eukprot:NODE_451_length_1488_cov_100.145481_g419_i0.p1 GENE.NODE_451_length_1488_cov_100.145481_g419_i0~~NODE_451_length_1488_cov_100.145481_g419_i0.p1  ORF type:complete len:213 (-),score=34.52 NODE_451_length_1488_cov_100.145481_g419_i0:166-804(-)
MEKSLSEYLRCMAGHPDFLREYYNDTAFCRNEELSVTLGIVDGIQSINFVFDLKNSINLANVSHEEISMYLNEFRERLKYKAASQSGEVYLVGEGEQVADLVSHKLAQAEDQNRYLDDQLRKAADTLRREQLKHQKEMETLQTSIKVQTKEHTQLQNVVIELQDKLIKYDAEVASLREVKQELESAKDAFAKEKASLEAALKEFQDMSLESS